MKDPSFGLDAVWILPHQLPEAEADDHVVVELETSVIATHLSQLLYRHAGDLIGPDDVQVLLDTLARSPTLVNAVVPELVPLHTVTAVLRHLAERIPVGDLRRILEGLAQISAANLPVAALAEALRPSLVPLLLQQVAPVGAVLPVVTLTAELETLMLRSRRQGDEALTLHPGFVAMLVRELASAHDSAGDRPLILAVSPALRRALAAILRPHLPDALVLSPSDIPEGRRLDVIRSIGLPAALPAEPRTEHRGT